jgi:hypothetical protein
MMKLVSKKLQALWVKADSFQSEEICNMKMSFRTLIANIKSLEYYGILCHSLFSSPSIRNLKLTLHVHIINMYAGDKITESCNYHVL